MQYYVGAYASSPCSQQWDAKLESQFYTELKKDKRIKGLEHPFLGQLHAQDDDWFLKNIDPNWQFVFTCVPGIMAALGNNPAFGLASDDPEGRKQAVAFMQAAHQAVLQLNGFCNKPVVTAIHIQTAPNQLHAGSSVAALKLSLAELQRWDWQGATLIIEHCDTLVAGQTPSKGFLTLNQEIQALQETNHALGCAMGLTINWGRSVIETRKPEGALAHIKQAREAGLLCGLMFSGASGADTEYGAWKDSHQPHAPVGPASVGAQGSLMTAEYMHQCLHAANTSGLPVVGIKLGIRPHSASLTTRLAIIDEALTVLEQGE